FRFRGATAAERARRIQNPLGASFLRASTGRRARPSRRRRAGAAVNGFGFLLLGVLLLLMLSGLSLVTGRTQRRRQQEMAGRLEELGGALPAEEGGSPGSRIPAGGVAGPRLFQLWQARADVAVPLQLVLAGGIALVAIGVGLTWLAGLLIG